MKEISKQNFGLLVAYLLPGLVTLWGMSYFSDTIRLWLTAGNETSPTVAGFLYVTLAAFTAGLTLGALRTVTIDFLHHSTGVPKPDWDFSEFQTKFWAFNQLVESHYCFYQFYAHMCLAVPMLLAAQHMAGSAGLDRWLLASCAVLELVLLVVSRATLRIYYTRASHLLGTSKQEPDARRPATRSSQQRRSKQPEAQARPTSQATDAGATPGGAERRRVERW